MLLGPNPILAVLSISDELFTKPERAGSAVGDIVYLKETDRGELDGASWPPGSGLLASARVRADEEDRPKSWSARYVHGFLQHPMRLFSQHRPAFLSIRLEWSRHEDQPCQMEEETLH
jgi:hypothetical protein